MIFVSVIGDSISTFEGYNPSGYSVFYNAEMQQRNGLSGVYDTWWAKVNQALHAFICVNNAYSGSRVTGNGFPAASCIERISYLKTAVYDPDMILIYIGFNDFGYGVSVSQNKPAGQSRIKDPSYFEDAYALMIDRVKEQYPHSEIVCGTLMRTRIKNNENWAFPENYAGQNFEDFNNAIRRIAGEKNVYLADVGALNTRYETLDGSHPTLEGHQTIADGWIKCLTELDLIRPSAEACIWSYHTNKKNDFSAYMVFQALSREKLLLAFDGSGNLMELNYRGNAVIPVFTSPDEIGRIMPAAVRPGYLRDHINILLSGGKQIVVNPFSSPEKQFFIPHEAVGKTLKPLIDNEKRQR